MPEVCPPTPLADIDLPSPPEHWAAKDQASLPSWKERLWRTTRKPLAGVAILASIYALDVEIGYQRLANTHPSIEHIYDANPSAPSHNMVLFLGGLGQRNAFAAAESLPIMRLAGEVDAVQYDNKGLDARAIANETRRYAHQRDITEITIVGSSMGGLEGLEVAADIQEDDDAISIKAVNELCTPDGFNSVRPDKQRTAMLLRKITSILPESKYSNILRYDSEMVARKDQFWSWEKGFNFKEFYETSKAVIENKFLSADAASSVLIDDQLNEIIHSPAQSALARLGKPHHGKLPPIIIYTRPDDPNRDTTVDVVQAEGHFRELAQASGLLFLTADAPGTEHANPAQRPTEYTRTMAGIIPLIIIPGRANPTTGLLALPVHK